MTIQRKIALKLLKLFQFNLSIRHHYTGNDFYLNSYTHKGYWFHGKKRESATVKLFHELIKNKNYVLEIGGHIGYFSTLFEKIVGPGGKVDVFEPSPENLKYLKKNITNQGNDSVINVIEKGAGEIDGILDFYIDPITGQNNSFVKEFQGFYNNRENSIDKKAKLKRIQVDVISLDNYFENNNLLPDFVKIDVEGFELNVIQGFKKTIEKSKPKLMIEVQRDMKTIFDYFISIGYSVFNDKMIRIDNFFDYQKFKTPNMFFIYS